MKFAQLASLGIILAMLALSPQPQVVVVPTAEAVIVTPTVAKKKIVKKKPAPGLYAFMMRMSKTESNHKANVVSKFGMLGKYQFAPATLRKMGYEVSTDSFLANEALQDKAMMTLMRNNRRYLRNVIREFSGKTFNGVYVTESGILAGAHLVGSKGVLAFFYPDRYDSPLVDRNGMTVERYMTRFAGYQLVGL